MVGGCIVLADDPAYCLMMLSGGGEGGFNESKRGVGLLVPFCSTRNIQN
jgi:hypothetical protein